MKRIALGMLVASFATSAAAAQGLTMGTMNGWTFTFSGNVNAFLVYTDPKCGGADAGLTRCDFNGSTIPTGTYEKVLRIRTGLAPAFAIFDAKGKEGDLDLGVHFGLAPEIQTPYQLHDNCGGNGGCGAQLDVREVYLTAGGSWGEVLAGRALGLYQGENLLTDMTVYGFGLSGGGSGWYGNGNGISLGHVGTGYSYPNFNSQMTYSTSSSKPGVFSIGLFDPSIIYSGGESFPGTHSPRLEASFVWTKHTGASGSADKLMLYASGLLASVKHDNPGLNQKGTASPYGLAGGVEWNGGGFQVDGSGFWQSGVGMTLMFDDGSATDPAGNMRKSYGFLLQGQYMFKSAKWKVGASYGVNHLDETSYDTSPLACDGPCDFVKYNSALVLSGTYMWTKSLRWVLEYTYGNSASWDGVKITSNQGALGMMLFF